MVRPYLYDHYGIDEYPMGTNAVVAVISYTVSRLPRAELASMESHTGGQANLLVH